MSFTEFALRMFPYWALGGIMFWAIWKSDYKDLLRFDLKTFAKFFAYMAVVSIFRYFMIKTIIHYGAGSNFQAVKGLPIGAVFFVFWEEMAHTAPLILLRRMIGTSKWTWPIHGLATAIVLVSFGLGHVYEGVFAAMIIPLYILFGISFGQKRGLGTLMAAHTLYDFLTLLVVKLAIG